MRKILIWNLFIYGILLGQNLIAQPNFTEHTVTSSFILAKKIQAADIDSDGDIDIVGAANDGSANPVNVAWFENDGDQNFTQHDLDTDYPGARTAITADFIPGNNYLEIVAGNLESNAIRMYEYDTGQATWNSSNIGTSAEYNFSLSASDINEDNVLDLLATYGPNQNIITWFENDGLGNFTEYQVTSSYINAADAGVGDVDNDGILDIFGVAFIGPPDLPDEENVNWWQGDGTPENGGWTKFYVDDDDGWPNSLDLVDLDQDGDLDVIVALWEGHRVSWWSNDGNGNFSIQPDIVTNFERARNALSADMDGDGDLDVVASADLDNEVSWFENDGNQNWTYRIISTSINFAYYAYPVDLEGDGDIDVVTSAQNGNEIAWWENDLDDNKTLASGDLSPVSFWNGNVSIDFDDSNEEEVVTVFYNAGENSNRNALGSGIDHIAQNGFYTITTEKTGYDASVDFYYGSGNVDEWTAIDNTSDLVICLWDDTNSQWVEAGSNQIVNDLNQYITVQGITSEFEPFSKWTLGSTSTDNPLPVQLLAFEAHVVNEGIKLQWTTASEINNMGFEIWRSSSPDSQYTLLDDFTTDENLRGMGNSNIENRYAYIDNRNLHENENYYYKLVDVDFNNQKSVHGPVSIHYTRSTIASNFVLGQNYPNPFNNQTIIPISILSNKGLMDKNVHLSIYSILGKEIRTFDLGSYSAGLHQIQWDGTDNSNQTVASGPYIYQLRMGEQTQTKKLLLVK